jgi:hypothetical protein
MSCDDHPKVYLYLDVHGMCDAHAGGLRDACLKALDHIIRLYCERNGIELTQAVSFSDEPPKGGRVM